MISKYILIFFWLGLCALLIYTGRFYRKEDVLGNKEVRIVPWFAILVFVPIVWMAMHRGYFADTGVYIINFDSMPDVWSGIAGYMENVRKDKGFSFLACLIRIYITHDYEIYLAIIAAVQSAALILVFRKYSVNYIISVFLFIVSTDYISWMFNGMRQFLAVAVILFATPLMLKKKYIPLFIVIAAAATIHLSALLMIPFVLIAQGKAWNRKTLIFIALIILATVFVERFTDFLDDSLSNTQYANVVSDYTSWKDNGTNILRVLVYSVPAVMGFFGRDYIRRSGDTVVNFCTNMSILSAGLYLLSWTTSGIFLGRLPIYASLYSYVLLPWEIDNMFSTKSRYFVYLVMIFSYLLFYFIQMHYIWSMF